MINYKIICDKCKKEKQINNYILMDSNNKPIISTICSNCHKKIINPKIEISEKICIKCNKTKIISEFNKSKETKDCLNSWCKSCHKEYKKQYTQLNKEYLNEYKRKKGYTTYAYQKKYYDKKKKLKEQEKNKIIINISQVN